MFDNSNNNYLSKLVCLNNPINITFTMLIPKLKCFTIESILDMDAFYEELCNINKSEHESLVQPSTLEKWQYMFSQVESLPNLRIILFLVFSIPVAKAFCERVISLVDSNWSDTRSHSALKLIKSEIQVKTNFTFSCQEFYKFAMKNFNLMNVSRSKEKYYCMSRSASFVFKKV